MIKLRTCTKNDWDIILDLRNQFYKGSFFTQTEILSKEQHYQYMKNNQKNPNFYQWMAILDNDIVGYIRILNSEINILVVKEFQNQGVGSTMLKLLEDKARELNIKKLKGSVRIDNIKSKKLFEKNGYNRVAYLFEKSF